MNEDHSTGTRMNTNLHDEVSTSSTQLHEDSSEWESDSSHTDHSDRVVALRDDAHHGQDSVVQRSQLALQESPQPNVEIDNSRDVQVGHRLNYNAPVTINQYLQMTHASPDLVTQAITAPILQEGRPAHVNINNCETDATQDASSSHLHRKHSISFKRYIILYTLLGAVCVAIVCLVVLLIFQPTRAETTFNSTDAFPPSNETDVQVAVPTIHSKQSWGGVPALNVTPLSHPIPIVIVSHTENRACRNFKDCSDVMKSLQKLHMVKSTDIYYNFLIGGDGEIYEGRGWDAQSSHKKPQGVLGICFIGDFRKIPLSVRQIAAAQKLLEYGVVSKKLYTNYALIAHNQTVQTTSPGEKVVSVISKWPHWQPDFIM